MPIATSASAAGRLSSARIACISAEPPPGTTPLRSAADNTFSARWTLALSTSPRRLAVGADLQLTNAAGERAQSPHKLDAVTLVEWYLGQAALQNAQLLRALSLD